MAAKNSTEDIAASLQTWSLNRPHIAQPNPPLAAPKAVGDNNPKLLKLPNELLLKIAGYLAPTSGLRRDQGYGSRVVTWNTTEARQYHASAVQALICLGLTCGRLLPIAQDILYREVSLPQPFRSQLPGTPTPSFLPCFLRTILQRPDLGAHVRKLAVWIWKGKPLRSKVDPKETFCACGTCIKALGGLVDTLKLCDREKDAWMTELSWPCEAAVCGLIFAALPKLRSLELHAKPLSVDYEDDHRLAHGRNKFDPINGIRRYTSDVLRLTLGPATTKLTSLLLSTNLNGLHAARLPTLTTLTPDYS
jgi:hypothetical protein